VLLPTQRVDVERERQTHAVREQLARESERVEHDLQREAERHADEQLLEHDDEALRRERRDGRCGNHRRDQRGDRHREMMRVRGGTKRAPNTGATIRHEPMRTKGKNPCATQPSSCPMESAMATTPPFRECFR
jgi:hypothetical protein